MLFLLKQLPHLETIAVVQIGAPGRTASLAALCTLRAAHVSPRSGGRLGYLLWANEIFRTCPKRPSIVHSIVNKNDKRSQCDAFVINLISCVLQAGTVRSLWLKAREKLNTCEVGKKGTHTFIISILSFLLRIFVSKEKHNVYFLIFSNFKVAEISKTREIEYFRTRPTDTLQIFHTARYNVTWNQTPHTHFPCTHRSEGCST